MCTVVYNVYLWLFRNIPPSSEASKCLRFLSFHNLYAIDFAYFSNCNLSPDENFASFGLQVTSQLSYSLIRRVRGERLIPPGSLTTDDFPQNQLSKCSYSRAFTVIEEIVNYYPTKETYINYFLKDKLINRFTLLRGTRKETNKRNTTNKRKKNNDNNNNNNDTYQVQLKGNTLASRLLLATAAIGIGWSLTSTGAG